MQALNSNTKDRLKTLFVKNVELINRLGSPFSRHILYRDILPHAKDSSQLNLIKNEIMKDQRISQVITKLKDTVWGIYSLYQKPVSPNIYGSYFWNLRFLADIGLTRDDIALDELLSPLFLFQLPDGQFTAGYHRKTQTPVSAICITANLVYALSRLGFENSRGFQAALNYIMTTQRKDGGWHCDFKKQVGEKDENAVSCPVANIFIIRALSEYKNYHEFLKKAIAHIISFCNKSDNELFCAHGHFSVSLKLRYPPHFRGFDVLNILDTLSLYPDHYQHIEIERLLMKVCSKWDGAGFFRSEKTIPEWKNFNFGKNKQHSDWISCIVCRFIKRLYSTF